MADASSPQTAAVYTTDADGFITLYNEAAVSLWGREPEIGKDRWCGSHRLYRPDGAPLSLDASPLAVALKEGRAIQGVELIIERPDGTRRHVLAQPELIRDSAGKVVGAINIFADMTSQTRMELLVAGQQRALQLAVHGAALGDVLEVLTRTIETHLADGVIASVLTLDRDGIHLRYGAAPNLPEPYNRAIDGVAIGPSAGSCGTAAFRNDTVIVEDIATDPLWAGFRTVALDHDLRACWSMPIRSSQQEVLGTFALYYKQVRNPRPQDREVVELLAHTAAVIIERDREGRERREAEQALRESEQRFRHMADHAPVMVWVTEPDGQCSFVSKSWYEFTGQDIGTGLGNGWIAALHPDDREPVHRVFASANSRREPFRLEFRLTRHDGVACWALVAAAPRLAPDGQFLGFIGSVLDIAERKQAEEALRQSEERFRIATQTGKVGVWDWDIVANRVLWTDSLYGIHGVSPDAFPATLEGFTALIHPDDRERVTRAVEHSLQDDVPYELEFRAVRPNGDVIWLFTNAVVLRDGGKPVRMLGATLDITRRKCAETALRESEAHYRTLMEQAHDSIFVCDGDGRFLMANSAGSRLLGYSSEELLQVRVRDTYLESEVDASERRLHEVAAGHSLRFERIMVRKDRSTFEADISLTRLPNGQVYAMVRDITDRKRAEDGIRTRTENMRLLSEALAQLLNARDPETIVRELFPKVAAHLSIDTYVNFMVDETGQALRLHSCAGIPDEVVRSIERLEFGQAISGTVAQLREPIVANDIQHSGYEKADLVRGFGIQSYVCHPLIAGGRLLGTLAFASRTRPSFNHDEIEFLRVISQYTAVALDRLHTTKALSEHSRSLEILHRVGSTLAAELDLNTVVQVVTDAGREVSGAEFGAFYYNLKDERGESYTSLHPLRRAARSLRQISDARGTPPCLGPRSGEEE